MFNLITWAPNEIAFHLFGYGVRWYSLCWGIGLVLAYVVVMRLYKEQRIPDEKFEPLPLYCLVGILLGARLGHCLFYEPAYFLAHPLEMFLPMRQTAEGWRCTGYAGLASHGGTAGLMLALWLYVRRTKVNLMRVLDNIAIATPTTACFIRLGNLMNSEIVGKPSGDSPLGFIFANNGETFARYPGQLFEAIAYAILFFIGWALYRKYKEKVGTGFFFGLCLTYIFTFRFFVEFLKEVQEPWELQMVSVIGLNQGQMLSIPFVVIGIYCLVGGKWCRRLGEKRPQN
ncbi:MAG: prolipoprotein diacylglyceryl transferase [Bacteroidaceae bacterium]|nr:prolipoprotein diacylglyceryl transferase [Bacteroidaceae bacterium]